MKKKSIQQKKKKLTKLRVKYKMEKIIENEANENQSYSVMDDKLSFHRIDHRNQIYTNN